MVVEEEILGEKTLAKLAECIYRDFDSWTRWRNGLMHGHAPSYQDLNDVVRSLKAWRARDEISDEQLRGFLILFLAHLVQSDVEGRFERVFEKRFRSLLSAPGK